jgi:uncharacterized protein YcfJ
MPVELVLPTASAIRAACAGDRVPKEIGGAVIGPAAGGPIGPQIGNGAGQLAATRAGGKTQSSHGTACREPDGARRIEN